VREASYRAKCLNNMHQLVVAFENVEGAWRRFPASCRVSKNDNNVVMNEYPGTGWSWCVDLLPYVGNSALHDTLDIQQGWPTEETERSINAHHTAMATSIDTFVCPTFGGNRYVDPETELEAITNYKAMTATHIESYYVATNNTGQTPFYGPQDNPRVVHPDGAIYPGSKHGHGAFSRDGESNTILLAESKEQYRSRWTMGTETAVVGIPVAELGGESFFIDKGEGEYRYASPQGFVANRWNEESLIDAESNRTYMNHDYEQSPYLDDVADTYREEFQSMPFYGPSSDHTSVVNHVFADGSARSLSIDMDVAAYMFFITRNNSDVPPPPSG